MPYTMAIHRKVSYHLSFYVLSVSLQVKVIQMHLQKEGVAACSISVEVEPQRGNKTEGELLLPLPQVQKHQIM